MSITKKLGVDYMHIVLRQMKLALHSGFMVHVLSYSVHAVLRAMYGDNKRIERSKDGSRKTSGGGSDEIFACTGLHRKGFNHGETSLHHFGNFEDAVGCVGCTNRKTKEFHDHPGGAARVAQTGNFESSQCG